MKFPWQRPQRFRHLAHLEGVLGTSLELQVVASLAVAGPQAEAAVLAEIDRLEAIFNAYNPASELRRWQETRDQDVAVSSELAHVLASAEAWRLQTRGAFNPAVEALTRVWKQRALANELPPPGELATLVAQMSGELWDVDAQNSTARRLTASPVTLNAIAKGFIIDAACGVAAQTQGVEAALINIGGDIRHLGAQATTIAIADPHHDAENSAPADRIRVCNQGIATSGNYRRGVSIGDRWYSHVLDPRTGWPVENLVGVSVLAPDTATADVLATAFCVLEPPVSLELADALGEVGVLLISTTGERFSNAFWNESHAAAGTR